MSPYVLSFERILTNFVLFFTNLKGTLGVGDFEILCQPFLSTVGTLRSWSCFIGNFYISLIDTPTLHVLKVQKNTNVPHDTTTTAMRSSL